MFYVGMVLETGSCLSLSLRLLKAAAGFPGNDITSGQELHPVRTTSQIRTLY